MQLALVKLRLQRNILLAISTTLVTSNLLLVFMLSNKETVTRLVPTITEEQIISGEFVSSSALKARAEQIIYLLFSMNKENADYVISSLLKQVDNSAYDSFKKHLEIFADDIKTRNYRYIFTANQGYEFDNRQFVAKVKGYLDSYIGGKEVSSAYKEYKISFFNRSGVLTIKSFQEVENESNH